MENREKEEKRRIEEYFYSTYLKLSHDLFRSWLFFCKTECATVFITMLVATAEMIYSNAFHHRACLLTSIAERVALFQQNGNRPELPLWNGGRQHR